LCGTFLKRVAFLAERAAVVRMKTRVGGRMMKAAEVV
jgi:hypothetical protein